MTKWVLIIFFLGSDKSITGAVISPHPMQYGTCMDHSRQLNEYSGTKGKIETWCLPADIDVRPIGANK